MADNINNAIHNSNLRASRAVLKSGQEPMNMSFEDCKYSGK